MTIFYCFDTLDKNTKDDNICRTRGGELRMNKGDLIDAIAKDTGLTKKDSEKALNSVIDNISKALAKKDKVQLIGFGTFETRKRAARTGRNPQTGEEIKIKASTIPAFKAGKALKEKVNK